MIRTKQCLVIEGHPTVAGTLLFHDGSGRFGSHAGHNTPAINAPRRGSLSHPTDDRVLKPPCPQPPGRTTRRRRLRSEGHRRFQAQVAANVVAIVRCEIVLGPAQSAAHTERLNRLGVADDVALARAIRSGEFAERGDEVRIAVRAAVVDKLRVPNPAYLEAPSPVQEQGTP